MPTPEWLTITAAAEYAGVSRTTIYNWIKAGDLPVHRGPTGARRIRRDDLDALYDVES